MIRRLFVGLLFALPMALLSVVVTQAYGSRQGAEPAADDCQDCHEIIRSYWEGSAHGQAVSDPVFRESWDAQNRPRHCLICHATGFNSRTGTWQSDGVTCQACHEARLAPNHPDDIMPTELSPTKLCGNCHIATVSDWQVSEHGSDGIICVNCHDPHATTLKKTDVASLCAACHNERVHFFTYSQHYAQELTCADCHLRVMDVQMGEGHGSRNHTFAVNLSSCTDCHAEPLHAPAEAGSVKGPPNPLQAIPSSVSATVHDEPNPVSPLGFTTLAGLVGIGVGIVLAPWLERWLRQIIRAPA